MKNILVDLLYKELKDHIEKQEISKMVEIPPSPDFGDFAFPCFQLAKIFRKNPALIAQELKEKLVSIELFSKIDVVSGYLNFFVDRVVFTQNTLSQVFKPEYGRRQAGKTVIIEFSSPNTNKPLHLGHLRNIAIGDCLARLSDFSGNRVVRVCINNDRGIHICKSILAYDRYGSGETPQDKDLKADHFVGNYYVLFNQKAKEDATLNKDAQELLRKWEAEDTRTRQLWQRMNDWAVEGFEETYRRFGITFDKIYYEHQIYAKGKEIVEDGLSRGVFYKKEDGTTAVDLGDEKLGEKILLRADGTAIYIVQDLFLAKLRFEEFTYDKCIYVVGNEQEYHFKVLFSIFKKLGYEFADKLIHLSYGMVELPTGKMKSREGIIVDADDLIDETQELAREELRQRYSLTDEVMEERSLKIALAAIKYQVLKVMFVKNILFDPAQAIRFEGDTGPYLLYSYARASSIIRKAGELPEARIVEPNDFEMQLLRIISQFPDMVSNACDKLSPSILCTYANELAQTFNEFYHNCPVLRGDNPAFRLNLVKAFKKVMKKVLNLLGIREIEEM